MKLISIISGRGFVMYNKELAHSASVNGAIIFGQLCSSYESFGNKDMLLIRDNKEYFFLTSETLQEETALTYKQQLKAIKELEDAGYIETKVMGVPSKKYFHITDKIIEQLIPEGNPSSAKREDLNKSTIEEPIQENDESSLAKRETLGLPKGNSKPLQKGSTIKKKNKKEQYKDNKEILVNNKEQAPEPVNNSTLNINKLSLFKQGALEAAYKYYSDFSIGRWDKKSYLDIVNRFIYETIKCGKHMEVQNVDSYVYGFLKEIARHHDEKYNKKEIKLSKINSSTTQLFLNVINGNGEEPITGINNDELPY